MATKKKTSAAKSKKGKQQTVNAPMKSEFVSLFTIVAALLLGVFLYVRSSGVVGEWVRLLFTGLFSLPAYLMPPLFLAFGIHRAIGKGYDTAKSKYLLLGLSTLSLSSLFHLFSGLDAMNPLWVSSISDYWYYGTSGRGGGVVGGFLCDVFANTIGSIGAGIVLFTVLLVLIMILTKWSPLKAFLRLVIRLFVDVQEIQKKAAEEAQREREKRAREQQEISEGEEKTRTKKRKIAKYS